VYCHVFCAFDALWQLERPSDLMEFRFIRQKFTSRLRAQLTSDDFRRRRLTVQPPLDTV